MRKLRRGVKYLYCLAFGTKQKQVMAIEHGARFGNFLYLFLHANIQRDAGVNLYILHTPNMELWLERFPALQRFVVDKSNFKWYDNLDWRTSYYQSFGKDFTRQQLNSFIAEYLLNNNSTAFERRNVSVINVRRGDFYTHTHTLPSSFDQVQYIRDAIAQFPQFLSLPIEVVSDDVRWCERNLSAVFAEYNLSVDFKYSSGPTEDFDALCSARQLIVTNSTFSYWGGYVCSFLSNENLIAAPNFGATFYKDCLAIQLHPQWKIIEVLKNV